MQSQISTSLQKIDLIYQILIQIRDKLSSNLTSSSEDGLNHNTHSINAPQSLDENRGASMLQGEAIVNENVLSSDARQLHQNPPIYPNNGYANLPSGANYRYDTAEWVIASQDLSIDNNGARIVSATNPEHRQQIREQDLSPQIQIQRLTAQLTAAYNRIAALEEQLLAKRWK